MEHQDALSVFLNDSVTKDKLAVRYSEVQGTISTSALSMTLKNTQIEGEARRGGTVKVRRMKTAVSQTYGTARAAGEGDKLQNNGVDVKIDTNREIIEEMELYDLERYGLDGLVTSRTANHALAMSIDLDRRYFQALQSAATVHSAVGSTTEDKVLSLIQALEAVENENVDKVDRALMDLTLAPEWYDSLLKYIHALPNPANGGVQINLFHGVRVWSAPRQELDAIIQVRGSVAQPVAATPYQLSRIPQSNAFSLDLFYDFGTVAVMPDLIFATALDEDISA